MASYGYDGASGWLSSLSATPAGGSATTLLGGLGYTGAGGAAGHATSASVGGGVYSFGASYDADTRLSSLSVSTISSGTTLFQSQRGYDAASNVTAVATTLAAGTDTQAFCYDEQNRLTWAGSTGTPSCGASLTAGSLSSASYTQTFSYDTLDRLTSGPLGSYTYGDAAHLHAVTSIGSGGTPTYTATYDAVGDMTCRAPDTTATCAGTPTGAVLGYDNAGRLTTWQNTPTSPTTSDSFLSDGAGNRVMQSVTINGSITTTTTYVAGGLEEISANGVGTTLTKYFTGASGLPTAERVGTNGPLSYLATDGQGTVSEALDSGGNVTFAQLYTPYGNARYSSGSSPTSIGYTGQRADGATGLDYYHARYYDPVVGQFTSADTVADGLNRYGYVGGNPATYTDPSGHRRMCADDCGVPSPPTSAGGGGNGGGGGCHSDTSCGCYSDCGKGNGYPGNVNCSPIRSDAPKTVTVDGHVCSTQECVRTWKLAQLDSDVQTKFIVGGVLQLIALLTAVLSKQSGIAILEIFLDAVDALNLLIPAIGKKIADDGGDPAAYTNALRIASVIDQLGGLANTAIGWWKTAGWIMQTAINGAILAVKAGVGGVEGELVDVTFQILGGAASLVLNGVADSFLAQGTAEYGEENRQHDMDIGSWCSQYGGGLCNGLPAQ